jgi:hypothetical protein
MDETVMHVLEFVFMAGAVYGAIRADIKGIHEKVAQAVKLGERAHDRIDELFKKGA